MKIVERHSKETEEYHGELTLVVKTEQDGELTFEFEYDERTTMPSAHTPFATGDLTKFAYPTSVPTELEDWDKGELVDLNFVLPNQHDDSDIVLLDKPYDEYDRDETAGFSITRHI